MNHTTKPDKGTGIDWLEEEQPEIVGDVLYAYEDHEVVAVCEWAAQIALSRQSVNDGDWEKEIDDLYDSEGCVRCTANGMIPVEKVRAPERGEGQETGRDDTDSVSHDLKILPDFFDAVQDGRKRFEIRKDDRDYAVGDTVVLREWNTYQYTGRVWVGRITYLTNFNQEDGWTVFGIAPTHPNTENDHE